MDGVLGFDCKDSLVLHLGEEEDGDKQDACTDLYLLTHLHHTLFWCHTLQQGVTDSNAINNLIKYLIQEFDVCVLKLYYFLSSVCLHRSASIVMMLASDII